LIPTIRSIKIFTDGSCHTQRRIGAWAALIHYNGTSQTLSTLVLDTTHQRMEVLGVIEAIAYVKLHWPEVEQIDLVSDSQYVIGLVGRQQQLEAKGFITKAGKSLNNSDLLKRFYDVIKPFKINFIKIKAHQTGLAFDVQNNNAVDQLCRQLVRTAIDSSE
jgi:ribonuclease HI